MKLKKKSIKKRVQKNNLDQLRSTHLKDEIKKIIN
jgi:hypothetical protein